MAFYQLTKTQKLPVSISQIWDFISEPVNLREITPGKLGLKVTSNNGSEKIYPGMLITYKVSPILGIKLNWMTEITHIKEHEYFVDEQRMGPYSIWHHEHKIEIIDGGVLMTDKVTYRPPFAFIGAIVNSMLIRQQLQEIFDYRSVALEKRFGKFN
jgi:ligand-binding SRPBCC domain-containing protein